MENERCKAINSSPRSQFVVYSCMAKNSEIIIVLCKKD